MDMFMIKDKRGSIGIFVLLAVLVLSIVVQQGATFINRQVNRQEDYLIRQQLNLITSSIMGQIAAKEKVSVGAKTLFEGELLPGKQKLVVNQEVVESTDHCFQQVVISAAVDSGAIKEIQQLRYIMGEAMQNAAKDYVLMSPALVQQNGADSKMVYKQMPKGEVVLPTLSFLTGKSFNSLVTVASTGYGKLPYYVTASNVTLSHEGNVSGSPLLASNRTITINENKKGRVTYLDNLIILSSDKIVIGKNIKFSNVLIISSKDISIDSDCEIHGAVFSKTKIILKGPSTFYPADKPIVSFRSAALSSFTN